MPIKNAYNWVIGEIPGAVLQGDGRSFAASFVHFCHISLPLSNGILSNELFCVHEMCCLAVEDAYDMSAESIVVFEDFATNAWRTTSGRLSRLRVKEQQGFPLLTCYWVVEQTFARPSPFPQRNYRRQATQSPAADIAAPRPDERAGYSAPPPSRQSRPAAPGQFQHPMIGPCAEIHLLHGGAHKIFAGFIQLAKHLHFGRAQGLPMSPLTSTWGLFSGANRSA